MKTRKLLLLLGFLILAFLLSGCASGMTPSSWPGLASDGENVYVAYANQVYAVQVSNGVEIWRFPEKVSAKMLFYAQPALTPDGQLIVSGYDSILYSLNPNDGSENWTFTGAGDRWIGSAAVDGDTIYAPNADYSLYALDLQGNLKWSFETGAAIWSRPVVGDNLVYVASMDSTIYALDITTGKKVWSQMLDGAVLGPLTIGNDGSVFATTLGETVYALNPSSGKIFWSSPSSAFIWSGAEPGDGSLFVGNSAGKFFSLDMKSGKENWLIQPDGSILGTSCPSGTGGFWNRIWLIGVCGLHRENHLDKIINWHDLFRSNFGRRSYYCGSHGWGSYVDRYGPGRKSAVGLYPCQVV